MIEQTAKVVSIKQGFAWVAPVNQAGNCGSCSKHSACSSVRMFNFLRTGKPAEPIYVANPLHAKPGDQVVIGMQGSALLMYSLFAYLLPLLSMIVFAILGKQLFLAMGMTADFGAILAGAGGLLSGLKLAGWIAKNIARSADHQPVILRHKDVPLQPLANISHA